MRCYSKAAGYRTAFSVSLTGAYATSNSDSEVYREAIGSIGAPFSEIIQSLDPAFEQLAERLGFIDRVAAGTEGIAHLLR
jgi:hypothetical protein